MLQNNLKITLIKSTGRNLQEQSSQSVREPAAPAMATQNNGYANGHQRNVTYSKLEYYSIVLYYVPNI